MTDEINFSRGAAVIMLGMYGCYLLFSLKTNRWEFEGEGEKGKRRAWKKEEDADVTGRGSHDEESMTLLSESSEPSEPPVGGTGTGEGAAAAGGMTVASTRPLPARPPR